MNSCIPNSIPCALTAVSDASLASPYPAVSDASLASPYPAVSDASLASPYPAVSDASLASPYPARPMPATPPVGGRCQPQGPRPPHRVDRALLFQW